MKNIISIKLIFLLFFLTSCQTIKDKTDAIVEKENAKLSEYIGKTSTNLQMDLGKPDEDFKNDKRQFRACLQYQEIWNTL